MAREDGGSRRDPAELTGRRTAGGLRRGTGRAA